MTDFIIKYRWLIVAFCLIIGAGAGVLIPMAETDPEMRNYIPLSMKSRIETDKIESEFGVQDMIVILFSDSCIINSDNLKQIKDIDRAISRVNGISSRISPFTVRTIKSEEGMMVAEPLIKEIPSSPSEIKQLGADILENRFARDIVVSSDLTTASITATISNTEAETRTLQKVDSVLYLFQGGSKITSGGLPYIRQSIQKDVNKDALILVPVALFIMLFILKTTLGSWRSVMMPFSVVVLSTAASMALIPLLGWKLSIITLLVPIILIAVANNYGIYLVARFQELKAQNPGLSHRALINELLRSLNMPILFSGMTTVAGILGLLTHSIIPAKQVGILAATGVLLALSLSLLLIPALIFIGGSGIVKNDRKKHSAGIFNKLLTRLSGQIIRNPGKILITSAILTLVISSGIFLLRINTNQETYFPKRHPIRQASQIINTKFGGSQTISVMIEGDIKSPEVMKGIDELTNRIETQKGVGQIFSISQVVREMSKAIFTNTEAGYDKIPESGEAIAQMFELYNMSGDQDDYKQLMNLENSKAHILIRLSEPENSVIKSVKTRISQLTTDFPAEVTVGGYAIIMADFAGSIIKGQVLSLLFAVVTVLVLLTIIFKSFKGGLICSIPLVASIFILFGFMGFTGIALDAATALLSSLMIGVGIDFTIQYVWCFNSQIRAGLSYPAATEKAMGTIGRSIIINGMSVMAGFSALMLSGFTSIRFFGYLVIISIGSCLIGAIVVIPALLMKFRPRFIGLEMNKLKNRRNETKSNVIGVPAAAFSGGRATA
ncbi:MAG TPA: efflux RND transporter permease subunit [Bacteroidales bacterium]|nr:efflux RND transporter permease subunit [Bacteroidales bacterium]